MLFKLHTINFFQEKSLVGVVYCSSKGWHWQTPSFTITCRKAGILTFILLTFIITAVMFAWQFERCRSDNTDCALSLRANKLHSFIGMNVLLFNPYISIPSSWNSKVKCYYFPTFLPAVLILLWKTVMLSAGSAS